MKTPRNKEAQKIYEYRKIHAIKRFSERYGKILSSKLYEHMCKLARSAETIMFISNTKKIVMFMYEDQLLYAIYSKTGKQIITFLTEKHIVKHVLSELEITSSLDKKDRKFYHSFFMDYLERQEDKHSGTTNKQVLDLLTSKGSCLTK